MNTFLSHIATTVFKKYGSFEQVVFVVPSIRAGTHLRTYLAQFIKQPIISPTIFGVEGFINEISQLQPVTNTQLLFSLFQVYQQSNLAHKDEFHVFVRWANTLLSDFDELDRYLIDTQELFQQLTELKKINEWKLEGSPTEMVRNYIAFNQELGGLHTNLTALLLAKHTGFQGLRYRIATLNLQEYLSRNKNKKHIFLGFNALNAAESTIIQNILSSSESHIFWDIDPYFLNDPIHSAGHFIRKYLKNWTYHKQGHPYNLPATYLEKQKIQITGIPKNISQTKYVGNLLRSLYAHKQNPTVALVLADESLLPAMLHAIPETVKEVNITMGFPLDKTVVADFFNALMDFYILQTNRGWPAKKVLQLFSHPIAQYLVKKSDRSLKNEIIAHSYNYINANQLQQWIGPSNLLRFNEFPLSSSSFLHVGIEILKHLRSKLQLPSELIELEAIHLYETLFNQLTLLIEHQPYLKHIKNLKSALSELVALETINFKGSPVKGLQVMGMLETRALDFETVIITSVNEGILPAGKSNNSFIPFDIKGVFNLPTFRDKDAIYTYHFYRLLQRAQNVYITYNTEPDVLEGGEKSRFVTQLLTDQNLAPFLSHTIEVPKVALVSEKPKQIAKTPKLMEQLYRLASSGFSPTSLSTYIKNPYAFYKRYVLGIQDIPSIVESIAPNTFGTIIHDSLEHIYTPFIGTPLSEANLTPSKSLVPQITKQQFQRVLGLQNFDKGQLLIVFNVVNKYVLSVIDHDIDQAKHHDIVITALEKKFQIPIAVGSIHSPIMLKGTIDRIESVNGLTRIIDYKTGQAGKSEVTLVNLEELLEKESKSKAFQLLSYCFMHNSIQPQENPLKAGILPIKNLSDGVLEFGLKASAQARTKDTLITKQTMDAFYLVLEQLIAEILDPDLPFTDTETELF